MKQLAVETLDGRGVHLNELWRGVAASCRHCPEGPHRFELSIRICGERLARLSEDLVDLESDPGVLDNLVLKAAVKAAEEAAEKYEAAAEEDKEEKVAAKEKKISYTVLNFAGQN